MLSVLALIGSDLIVSVLAPIILLGSLIFIHEFGHFIFAKLFGVAVEQFSFGFGPRIAGVRVGATDYRLNLIPLGGYVKMYGDDPYDIEEAERDDGFLKQSVWKRLGIVAAGPIFNLILPIFLFTGVYASGSPEALAWVGTIEPGSSAEQAGLRYGDQIVSVGGQDVRFWTELAQALVDQGFTEGQPLELMVLGEDDSTRTVSFTPPFVEGIDGISRADLGFSFSASIPIVKVVPGGGAEVAGLLDGDHITQVDGRDVRWWYQVRQTMEAGESFDVTVLRTPKHQDEEGTTTLGDPETLAMTLSPKTPELTWSGSEAAPAWLSDGSADLVAVMPSFAYGLMPRELNLVDAPEQLPAFQGGIREGDTVVALEGEIIRGWPEIVHTVGKTLEGSVSFVLLRGQELLPVSITPEVSEQMMPTGEKVKIAKVGIGSGAAIKSNTAPMRLGLVDAFSRGTFETGLVISTTVHILGKIFTGDIPVEDSIGGPIAIVKAAQDSANVSVYRYLKMMAMISVSLGLMNLLPIPLLDGGHILFFSVEAIRGKPVSLRFREISHQVGLLFLLSLIVFAIINDTRLHILAN